MEPDIIEAAQLATQASTDNQPPILSLSKKIKLAAKGTGSTTSSCIHSCCRRRRRDDGESNQQISNSDCELNDLENVGTMSSRGQQVGVITQPQAHSHPTKSKEHRLATEGISATRLSASHDLIEPTRNTGDIKEFKPGSSSSSSRNKPAETERSSSKPSPGLKEK